MATCERVLLRWIEYFSGESSTSPGTRWLFPKTYKIFTCFQTLKLLVVDRTPKWSLYGGWQWSKLYFPEKYSNSVFFLSHPLCRDLNLFAEPDLKLDLRTEATYYIKRKSAVRKQSMTYSLVYSSKLDIETNTIKLYASNQWRMGSYTLQSLTRK